jgi:hypothetical protein
LRAKIDLASQEAFQTVEMSQKFGVWGRKNPTECLISIESRDPKNALLYIGLRRRVWMQENGATCARARKKRCQRTRNVTRAPRGPQQMDFDETWQVK